MLTITPSVESVVENILNIKSGLNNFVSKDIDGYQMMNLLDPDIPLDYLLPMSLPYSKSYQSGIPVPPDINSQSTVQSVQTSPNSIEHPFDQDYDPRTATITPPLPPLMQPPAIPSYETSQPSFNFGSLQSMPRLGKFQIDVDWSRSRSIQHQCQNHCKEI